MSSEQNAGQNHNIQIPNIASETVAKSAYLGTLTYRNCLHEEIKSTLNLGNVCYHSVQNFLSSHLQSKNIRIKTFTTIIFPAVLYGCETRSLTLREKHMLWMFQNRRLRRYYGLKGCHRPVEKTAY